MTKQYVKASNSAPSFSLSTILLGAMAIKMFHYRLVAEEGVDVVKR